MIQERDAIKKAALQVAELMVAAAKTAPKARGIDNIVSVILTEKEELEELAKKMEELAPMYGDFFRRDATNVRNSDAVVIIGCKIVKVGLRQPEHIGIDVELANSLVNLGIAVGSAAKVASMLNVDNRIMYSIGVAALAMKLLEADYALGVPLSIKAKNIYFDRVWPPKQ
ncbi:MAG: DUF2148 domain-containing protein [Desulfurococcaceae archaeon]